MFGLQSVLGISQKTDPRQDSGSSTSSKPSLESKSSEFTSRGSSTFSFLSRSTDHFPSAYMVVFLALHALITHIGALSTTCIAAASENRHLTLHLFSPD